MGYKLYKFFWQDWRDATAAVGMVVAAVSTDTFVDVK